MSVSAEEARIAFPPGDARTVRPHWLALHDEEILHPDWKIVDSHHHVWDNPYSPYMADDLLADVNCGHRIVATVHVEAHAMVRPDGPPGMRPVNETEFVNGIAALSATGRYGPARLCAAIVGHADLRLGASVREVLEAHVIAGGGRFRGIRHFTNHDADPDVMPPLQNPPPAGLMGDARFREGFAQLAPLGLSFDACLYFHQLDELVALADAFPDTRIVLNHTGGVIGVGSYAGRRGALFPVWHRAVREVARCPNVFVKLGWLGSRVPGFAFYEQPRPPSSQQLEDAWGDYFHACIEAFGPQRCMIESNFPVDKVSASYCVMMNMFKRIAARYTPMEGAQILALSAADFYAINGLCDD